MEIGTVRKRCKLLGLSFSECHTFLLSLGFRECVVNLSSFYKLKLKSTRFENCKLHEVDFVESDLTSASFVGSDLMGAVFDRTILDKCDFRNSFNYLIDLEKNRAKKAKFSANGLSGLLYKYDIIVD